MKVLHCDLRWVNEIYPFKKGIAKSFQKCVEIAFNLKNIDFCNTFINNNHHLPWDLNQIILCVSDTNKVAN
jgi:hypothetical protein